MEKYPDFWHTLLGPGPVGMFLAFLVIAYFCALGSLIYEASTRDISSANTPNKWSWKFLWAANLNRVVANLMLIPVVIRLLYTKMGAEAMIGTSIGIGIAFDRIFMYLKNKGVALFTNEKAAQKVADKIAPNDIEIKEKNQP